MSIDLAEVERELCRIPEVRAARIVADSAGNPVEVHVLAAPGKHAKQVVRDVQSVAMASVGLDLDHRIVSVVQLDDANGAVAAPPLEQRAPEPAAAPEPEAAPDTQGHQAPTASPTPRPAERGATAEGGEPGDGRILIETVLALRKGLGCAAEVVLRRGDETVTGTSEGSAAASATHRTIAEATLEALRQLEPGAQAAHIETATVTRLGDRSVAVTSLVLVVPPNEELVTGSAPVRMGGEAEALARAVLDATNRRLPQLG